MAELFDLTRLPILDAAALLVRQGINPELTDWRTLVGLHDDFFNQMVRDPFHRYAEAIQLAPASEADHHANPGGLLSHSYDVITLALKRRRGLQLPHGGSIEQISEQRHLWTYAVFAGGLLHDIGKLMANIRLRVLLKNGSYYHWTPQDKPLRDFKDALNYRVEFVKTPYAYHTQIALTLFDFIPTSGRAWLAREPHIMMQLCAFLRGDRFESGVIGEILESADMASTAASQKMPTQQRFSTKPSTIERLVHWVRNWIIEGDIKINKNGAMGWVDSDGHLFIVCRSLADKIIHHCDEMGITDIPRDPIRLYDIFQDYGFALPTPDGKAIWNMLIECADYKHALTCLKFEARRFTIPTRPIASFDGMISVYGKQKTASMQTKSEDSAVRMEKQIRDALNQLGGGAIEDSAIHESESQESAIQENDIQELAIQENNIQENEMPWVESVNKEAVPCELNQETEVEPVFIDRIETVDNPKSSAPNTTVLLKVPFVESARKFTAEPDLIEAEHAEKPEQKKFSRYTISGVPSYEPGMVTMDAPDLGRMFVTWLRINMLGKTIQMNCPDALIHILNDGILLLAPGIFKNFLHIHSIGSQDDLERNHKRLSEKFQRLKIHIKTDTSPSINIHKMYAVGKSRASKINGWKIPHNIIYSDKESIPEPNRFIKSSPDFS